MTALATVALTPAGAQSVRGKDFGAFRVGLDSVPHDPEVDGGSEATARATIVRSRDRLTVIVRGEGFAPNLPHAQHIHGNIDGEATEVCPGPDRRDDRVDDGLIDVVEGLPDYGPVNISLTTSGDTSAASGLAVDRFPVADEDGDLFYVRSFKVDPVVADQLGDLHVVIHGIDTNNNGAYDFSAGPSSLDPSLPLEATVPAACGEVIPGSGSNSDIDFGSGFGNAFGNERFAR
jgi:hypothetical protein